MLVESLFATHGLPSAPSEFNFMYEDDTEPVVVVPDRAVGQHLPPDDPVPPSAVTPIRPTDPTLPPITEALGFRRWTLDEMLAQPADFEWFVKGLLAEGTYGFLAGEMKTLKTYLSMFMMVGLATGTPIFGRFIPTEQRPVAVYVGEGGQKLWVRRLRRICDAMGVKVGDCDIHPTFDVGPVGGDRFRYDLQHVLDDIKPGLVLIDPWYAYHGSGTLNTVLHQEGELLNQVSIPCVDAGACLLIANHFNQTGSNMSIKRTVGSGMPEWADTWMLVGHGKAPDVDAGEFHLAVDIGSRQWGGSSWELDLSIGHFNEDTRTHDGDITWNLQKAGTGSTLPSSNKDTILSILAEQPLKLTKTEIKSKVGGDRKLFSTAWQSLVDDHKIEVKDVARTEGNREVTRPVWTLSDHD